MSSFFFFLSIKQEPDGACSVYPTRIRKPDRQYDSFLLLPGWIYPNLYDEVDDVSLVFWSRISNTDRRVD